MQRQVSVRKDTPISEQWFDGPPNLHIMLQMTTAGAAAIDNGGNVKVFARFRPLN